MVGLGLESGLRVGVRLVLAHLLLAGKNMWRGGGMHSNECALVTHANGPRGGLFFYLVCLFVCLFSARYLRNLCR